MSAIYNEIEPFACDWLENLIEAGCIAPGRVDRRSIVDIEPWMLEDATQFHAFAGIAGWSYALRLAGWADTIECWTGSCPCQPVSQAGRRKGVDDERHLWPEFFRLIEAQRPPIVFLEQVASSDVVGKVRPEVEEEAQRVWIDAVQTDLASSKYAFGFALLSASSVGAPHIRQRLFAVAYSDGKRLDRIRLQLRKGRARRDLLEASGSGTPRWMANSAEQGRLARRRSSEARDGQEAKSRRHRASGGVANGARSRREKGSDETREAWESGARSSDVRGARGLGDSSSSRGGRDSGAIPCTQTKGGSIRIKARDLADVPELASATRGFWGGCDWLFCQDGKWRPAKSSIEPLAHGASERVGRLRAYGNGIVAPLAAAFIETVIDLLVE